jgi:formylglycine-generating enzyme required for sulfatase activity
MPAATNTPPSTLALTLGIATKIRPADEMVMVYVPAGSFQMGSTDDEVEAAIEQCNQDRENGECPRSWYEDESPRHSVTLDGFWIDQTEVTNRQYQQCVEATDCAPPQRNESPSRVSYYGNSQYDDYPVIWVSWYDAVAYCEWAKGRLPTEAEWEYAARGLDSQLYPWGDDTPNDTLLNYAYNQRDTAEVGSYPSGASWAGALDMAGNVWEWVSDWYADDYYATSPKENPMGPDRGDLKVLRGGGWDMKSTDVRTASRLTFVNPVTADATFGFRCAASEGD